MVLSMYRDVMVEKVLGIALWSYWEAGKHKRMLTIDRLYIHMCCTLEIPVLVTALLIYQAFTQLSTT